jgi:hypothetical protein
MEEQQVVRLGAEHEAQPVFGDERAGLVAKGWPKNCVLPEPAKRFSLMREPGSTLPTMYPNLPSPNRWPHQS